MRFASLAALVAVLGSVGLLAANMPLVDPSNPTRRDSLAVINKREGQFFFAENAKKKGVKTLPSGLQYKVLKSGDQKAQPRSPKLTDVVLTNYRGTLLDGTEIDSSFKAGRPISFPVDAVIEGWTEALQLMHVGDKWQLFIPPDLAYGHCGVARTPIGPNETLIFEVELLGIKGADDAPGKSVPPR